MFDSYVVKRLHGALASLPASVYDEYSMLCSIHGDAVLHLFFLTLAIVSFIERFTVTEHWIYQCCYRLRQRRWTDSRAAKFEKKSFFFFGIRLVFFDVQLQSAHKSVRMNIRIMPGFFFFFFCIYFFLCSAVVYYWHNTWSGGLTLWCHAISSQVNSHWLYCIGFLTIMKPCT